MSFNGGMAKQTVVHSHHGILFSNTKEQTIDPLYNLDGSRESYAE